MDINNFIQSLGIFYLSTNQIIMIVVGLIILFLAIKKKFEPLLLLPIGFGAILSNIPEIGLALSPIEQLLNEAKFLSFPLLDSFLSNNDLTLPIKEGNLTSLQIRSA